MMKDAKIDNLKAIAIKHLNAMADELEEQGYGAHADTFSALAVQFCMVLDTTFPNKDAHDMTAASKILDSHKNYCLKMLLLMGDENEART